MRNYNYKCEGSHELRIAIDNGDAAEILREIANCYQEIKSNYITNDIDFMDECDNSIREIMESIENEEYNEDNIEYLTGSFYDFCNDNDIRVDKILLNVVRFCYELYKVDWMSRISTERQLTAMREYYKMTLWDDFIPFKYYISDRGYDGEIYACFDEFLECEFKDKEYMRNLLTDELYDEYLECIWED